jgi:hypothetical protein
MKVAYRPYAVRFLTGKANVPHVKAVRVGDRPAILFSREDLTAGLVGQPVGGVIGYTPATATELMRRFVLRAAGMKDPAPAATQPSTKPAKGKKKATPTFEIPPDIASKPATPAPAASEGTGLE